MNIKQHTLLGKASVDGVGLHTGISVKLSLLPAEINQGIVFKRIDLENGPIIPADVDYVVDTSRGTVLEKDGAKVHTTEHILSALAGLQIDNVIIELNGPEVPILDGSAEPFVKLILNAGIAEQNAQRNYFEVKEAIHYKNNEKNVEIAALPLDDYRVTTMVDYNSKVLQSQHAQLHDIALYPDQIAPSRTFVFVHELESLYKAGLIKGGDLDNAIVIAEDKMPEEQVKRLAGILGRKEMKIGSSGILNDMPLKFKNEPARHKLLDLIGDLALVGRPIKAHILAARPGHSSNVEMARLIKAEIKKSKNEAPNIDLNAEPVFTIHEIAKLLPHRYPFQLVDKVMSLDGTSVVGVKNVSMNEPYFMGHFPENPVMPGVMQVEAIAQTGGVLVLTATGEPENYWPYLVNIEKCRFFRNVLPGDTLVMRCLLNDPIRMGVAKMSGEAYVGNNLVCTVNMTARLVRKN